MADKINVYEREGRTRDERETCFPCITENGVKNKK